VTRITADAVKDLCPVISSIVCAKIERDVIARGIFTSVSDLKRKLMRYIRQYNQQPKPVKWKYIDTSRRITPESIVTGH
jgi:hypothetical protein